MGRRPNLFSKKMIKEYDKKPYLLFYAISISCLPFSIVIFFDLKELRGIGSLFLITSVICLLIGIVKHILFYSNKEEEQHTITNQNQTSTTTYKEKVIEAPAFDFFKQDSALTNEYIAELINAQSKINTNAKNGIGENSQEESINSFDFNKETRVLKISFKITTHYRTIERYVQRDYQRYPIYSALKTKSKINSKTYRLTNENLESLHNDFAYSWETGDRKPLYLQIICMLNCPELTPSHFILIALGNQFELVTKYNNQEIDKIKIGNKRLLEDPKQFVFATTRETELLKSDLEKLQNKKPNQKREEKISYLTCKIRDLENQIAEKNLFIEQKNNEALSKIDVLKADTENKRKIYMAILRKNKPLSASVNETSGFESIKIIQGIKYEKIVGCYIIRNTEKDKYYVGQSKDVIRRLKQHFKGTIPNNQIFAKDYYTSSIENKENLFEFKIIKLETKDELDKTEKDLIEKYDAFVSGYNGTHGNT